MAGGAAAIDGHTRLRPDVWNAGSCCHAIDAKIGCRARRIRSPGAPARRRRQRMGSRPGQQTGGLSPSVCCSGTRQDHHLELRYKVHCCDPCFRRPCGRNQAITSSRASPSTSSVRKSTASWNCFPGYDSFQRQATPGAHKSLSSTARKALLSSLETRQSGSTISITPAPRASYWCVL